MEESKVDIVASAIGLKATLTLCAHFGGRTLYVPTRIEADHPIALLITLDKAQQLASVLGGEEITLPVVDLGHERRAARVIRFLVHGLKSREIAALENVSERTVTRIADKHRDLIKHFRTSQRWRTLMNMPVRES